MNIVCSRVFTFPAVLTQVLKLIGAESPRRSDGFENHSWWVRLPPASVYDQKFL